MVLNNIHELKTKLGTWKKVANELNISERTLYRWKQQQRVPEFQKKNIILKTTTEKNNLEILKTKEKPQSQILQNLKNKYGTWKKVSEKTGIPTRTIRYWRQTGKFNLPEKYIKQLRVKDGVHVHVTFKIKYKDEPDISTEYYSFVSYEKDWKTDILEKINNFIQNIKKKYKHYVKSYLITKIDSLEL